MRHQQNYITSVESWLIVCHPVSFSRNFFPSIERAWIVNLADRPLLCRCSQFFLLLLYVHGFMCAGVLPACMEVQVPQMLGESAGSPELEQVVASCCVCWKPNLGPLKEQHVLSTPDMLFSVLTAYAAFLKQTPILFSRGLRSYLMINFNVSFLYLSVGPVCSSYHQLFPCFYESLSLSLWVHKRLICTESLPCEFYSANNMKASPVFVWD